MKCWWMLLGCLACGSQSESPKKSSPVGSGEEAFPVMIDLGTVKRPDGKAVLTASKLDAAAIQPFLPDIAKLDVAEEKVLLDAINQTTAPCSPCLEDGISLGSCTLMQWETCPTLPTLMHRAYRVAIQGGTLAEAQAVISMVEPWEDVPLLANKRTGEVLVTLAVDYLDPFSHRAWKPWAALSAEYGDAIQIQLLHAPQSRHAGAESFAELVLQAGTYQKDTEMHLAILRAGEEPVLESVKKQGVLSAEEQPISQAAKNAMKTHSDVVKRLGVDATPVAWINGYRLSGQREISILQRFVDLALIDVRESKN